MNKYLMRPFAFTFTIVCVALATVVCFYSSCSKIHFEADPVPPYIVPTPSNLSGQPNIIFDCC